MSNHTPAIALDLLEGRRMMSVAASRVVITTGQPTGALPGTAFNFADVPSINDAGQIAFYSNLLGPGYAPFDGSVWRAVVDPINLSAAPTLGLVAAKGQAAPGTASATFLTLGSAPNVNDAGQLTFFATFNQGGDVVGSDRDTAQYVGTPGNTSIRFREGDAAPNAPAGTIFNDAIFAGGNARLGDGGVVAQRLGLRSNSGSGFAGDVILAGTLNAVEVAAKQYQAVTGVTSSTGPFTLYTLGSPATNDDGSVAFSAYLYNESASSPTSFRVLLHRAAGATSFTIAAQPGTPVPDVAPGATLGSVGDPTINGAGQLAFNALVNDATNATSDVGLFVGTPNDYRLVARNFQPAPGLPGVQMLVSSAQPILNAQGQVAFRASLIGEGITSYNNEAVYLWSPVDRSLKQVWREGDVAPGLGGTATFGALETSPSLNSAGQVVLRSMILNYLPGTGFDRGIFATEANGGALFKVAAEGDVVTTSPGVTRTILALDLYGGSGGEDGLASSLNDAGQIAYLAYFQSLSDPFQSDARAIIVADTLAAPAAAPIGSAAYVVSKPTGPTVELSFTSDVLASLSPSDLKVRNVVTGQVVTPTSITPEGAKAASVRLPAGLPDGDWELTVSGTTVSDAYGRKLSGGDVRLAFFTLTGDVNRDRSVNFDDLVILSQNYNRAGMTYGQGNLDYSSDGKVDFSDLVILAQHYGASLGSLPAAVLAPVKAGPAKRGRAANDVLA